MSSSESISSRLNLTPSMSSRLTLSIASSTSPFATLALLTNSICEAVDDSFELLFGLTRASLYHGYY